MKHLHWNIYVLVIILFLLTVTAAINYERNFFGVYGNVSGKKFFVYENERGTKYLFGYNYIPSNFDSLLVGPSVSDNWKSNLITNYKFYNASLNGSNISEESLIVTKVLERRQLKATIFLVHPTLTETHGTKSGYMFPREYWSALGSVQVFRGYVKEWFCEKGLLPIRFDEFGRFNLDLEQGPHPDKRDLFLGSQSEFFIDAQAFNDYSSLLNRVRSSGSKIIGVIPPIRMDLWDFDRDAFAGYYSKMLPLFRKNETVINLNDPEFNNFRSTKANFQDEVHLTSIAADQIVEVLADRLKALH